MEKQNRTVVTEFILKSITDRPELQAPLFGLLLVICLISAVGNLSIIILTNTDSRLQTPMYFFLRHLAVTDLCYSTSVGPKITKYNPLSTSFILFITCEIFLLSSMSYDRYVAICKPLLYTVIMPQRVCWALVAIPYVYSIFVSSLYPFVDTTPFHHFFCDCIPLISLLCSNTHESATFGLISSLLIILVSYILILTAVLRMNSAEGRRKAFSTCGSHLTGVIVFYGTLIFMYVQPKSSHSFDTDKVAFIFYTLIIPMLNPLIYSLRNKDV
uniref:Olfactory receptor n=1 Tax=Nannospalax galili TaxID=1026970 RepID=A0A8C6S2C8_NANGA